MGLAIGIAVHAESFRTDINPALRYYLALLMEPKMSQADRDYLSTNEWRGRTLDQRFGKLVESYDNEFKTIRQAGRAKTPCDWGIDYSDGPYTLLPGLARWKGIGQTARLRTLWDLKNGKEAAACDDLIGAMALGRNASRDASLIARLVGIATENIVCLSVAENYGRFSPESLEKLIAGFDKAPARSPLAAAIPGERATACDWLIQRLTQLRAENPGNDAPAFALISELLLESDEGQQDGSHANAAKDVIAAAGGTSEGVLKFLRELPPLYDRLQALMSLPHGEFEVQYRQFEAEIKSSPNPLTRELLPAIGKARAREFMMEAKLAMVRAAVAYKAQGQAGLARVSDPHGSGPFSLKRITVEGIDRGFALSSAYSAKGFPETLVFVERDGPALSIDGEHAGQLLSPQAK